MESNVDAKPIFSLAFLSVTLFILTSSILLVTYLALNGKQLPYKYQSNFWMIIIIISVIIDQLFMFVLHLMEKVNVAGDYQKNLEKNTFIVNSFFIHPLIFISVITRAYSIAESVQYNSNTLTQVINGHISQHKHEQVMSVFFKKQFRYVQVFLASFGFISVFFVVLYYTTYLLECLIEMYSWFYLQTRMREEIKVKETTIGLIVYFVLWYSLLLFYVTLIFKIIRYRIKKDTLKLGFEFICLLLIFLIHFNLKHVLKLFNDDKMNNELMNYDSGFNVLIIALYIYLTIWRYCKFRLFSMKTVIKEYHQLLKNKSTFHLFKQMIDDYDSDSTKYLLFWDEYTQYLALFRRGDDYQLLPGNIDNETNRQICSKGRDIYSTFYNMRSNEIGNVELSHLIDFPDELFQRVKAVIDDSEYDSNAYSHCFNDSFNWVKGKLEKILSEFRHRKEDMNKLERLMFFIECYEI